MRGPRLCAATDLQGSARLCAVLTDPGCGTFPLFPHKTDVVRMSASSCHPQDGGCSEHFFILGLPSSGLPSWSHILALTERATWIQSSFWVSLSYLSPCYSLAITPPCSTTTSEFMIVSFLGSKGLLHVPDSLMPVWKMGKPRTWLEESFVELLPDMFTFSCLDALIFLLL